MLKRTILILFICVFTTVACDKFSFLKKDASVNDNNVTPIVINPNENKPDKEEMSQKIADLEMQLQLLKEESESKANEITNLQAMAATAEASLANVNQELINANKTKRMLSIIIGISIFLNIIFVWIILRRKNDKVLALPKARFETGSNSENNPNVPKDEKSTNAEEKPAADANENKPKIDPKLFEMKPKRGRKPKAKSDDEA